MSLIILTSCNIFSPDYDNFENVPTSSDNKTIDGLMRNFVYSYTFKDSFLYEEILDQDFLFEYDNEGIYESWTKDEDIRITKRIFRSFKKIDLVFNTIFPENTSMPDTTLYASFRIGFYSGEEVINLTGFSKFTFKKYTEEEQNRYTIKYWGDLK
ncbi:MAG: hypothetical protein KKD38_00985 [Candidatus Delongbacteria bacterium]|nr:hypothetical protein [Candidatus Delongbacteria bacterium]MCG2760151.1 hypothetical protein [Candidatus Delongbacteria bacterium]